MDGILNCMESEMLGTDQGDQLFARHRRDRGQGDGFWKPSETERVCGTSTAYESERKVWPVSKAEVE